MEFWEAAVLTLGGLYLIGRMSRSSPTHPLNLGAPVVFESGAAGASSGRAGTTTPLGNTIATNTDGSTALIAGEPLTPAAGPFAPVVFVPHLSNPVTQLPRLTPVASSSPVPVSQTVTVPTAAAPLSKPPVLTTVYKNPQTGTITHTSTAAPVVRTTPGTRTLSL